MDIETFEAAVGEAQVGDGRAIVYARRWRVSYINDDGERCERLFDHEPSQGELAALCPRRSSARSLVGLAVAGWQSSQERWTAAAGLPQSTQGEVLQKVLAELAALHEEHVAVMRALRALAAVERLSDD